MKFLRALVSLVTIFAFMLAQEQNALAQDSAADARNTAATIAQGLQGTVTSTVTSTASTQSVPGYDGSTPSQSQYFNSPDSLAGAGATAAQSSSAYQLTTTPTTTKIDPSSINLTNAKTIEANPSAYTGVDTSGSSTSGNCQAVQATGSAASTYYDSCQIGSTETDSSFACTVGWNDVVKTNTTYSCEQKTVSGVNTLVTADGQTIVQPTSLGVVDSCSQLAALSYCTQTGSSTVKASETYGSVGYGSTYQPPVIQFPAYSVDTTTNTYACSQSVAVAAASSPAYTTNAGASFNVTAAAQQTGSSSTLVSSTIDDSACQAQVGSITCPSGSTLQNGQCVSTVPATLTYNCPSGWALSGTTCTLQQVSTAAITGYNCPANYTLSGSTCVSTQPAGINGYTCPSGYTLDGTTCFQTLTQPARAASYSCPDGYTLSGTVCYETLTQAANVAYLCPTGYALSGTTCVMTTQDAAIISYVCPSGWTLDGQLCKQQADYQALNTYTCPSTWTLVGSTCQSASTYNASLIYTCPEGWDVQGASCLQRRSYAPAVSYSCPGGWDLNGTSCVNVSSYPATVTYSCPGGWSQDGSSCTTQASTPATLYYGCPSGYSLNGTSCTITNTYPVTTLYYDPNASSGYTTIGVSDFNGPNNVSANPTYAAMCGGRIPAKGCGELPPLANGCMDLSNHGLTFLYKTNDYYACYYHQEPFYFCWSGGAWNGSQCVATSTIGATAGYSCSAGQTLNGSTCYYNVSQGGSANYSCGDGSAPNNGTCYITSYQAASANYSCPSGGSFDGSQCQVTDTQPGSPSYICPNGGSLNGTTCIITNVQDATSNYSCPQGGSLNGTTCNLTNMQPASVVYGCPAGATLSGTMCLTEHDEAAAPQYSCPSTYQLQGTQCVLSQSTYATPYLVCPDGYTLNGTTCSETISIAATKHYACATGYTLDGTTCTATVGGTVTGYNCPTGYSISGTTCVVSATEAASQAYTCPGGGVLNGSNCVTTSSPNSTTGLTCQNPVETCTDSSNPTRDVDGASVTHSCWSWGRNYQCAKLTPANDCGTLSSQSNCKFDHESCLDDGCYTKSEVYLCTTATTPTTSQAVACKGDIYCIDGSCTQVTREASPDFQDALVAINAMGDASAHFDPDSLTIFGGDATGCHKPLFGLVNCCAGKVSGLLTFSVGAAALLTGGSALIGLATNFLTLFLCSSEELQLDVKDRMGVCHYVGEYCSEKLLFACTTLRHQYCCYQTKLARVIQEQGHEQLNKSWGDPSNPQCGGFTIDEFSRLDLSKMDFTEVYSDFTSAVSVPSSLQKTEAIQQKISEFYSQHSGS